MKSAVSSLERPALSLKYQHSFIAPKDAWKLQVSGHSASLLFSFVCYKPLEKLTRNNVLLFETKLLHIWCTSVNVYMAQKSQVLVMAIDALGHF